MRRRRAAVRQPVVRRQRARRRSLLAVAGVAARAVVVDRGDQCVARAVRRVGGGNRAGDAAAEHRSGDQLARKWSHRFEIRRTQAWQTGRTGRKRPVGLAGDAGTRLAGIGAIRRARFGSAGFPTQPDLKGSTMAEDRQELPDADRLGRNRQLGHGRPAGRHSEDGRFGCTRRARQSAATPPVAPGERPRRDDENSSGGRQRRSPASRDAAAEQAAARKDAQTPEDESPLESLGRAIGAPLSGEAAEKEPRR